MFGQPKVPARITNDRYRTTRSVFSDGLMMQLRRPRLSLGSMASMGIASSILYGIGYHEGSYPIVGFCLAVASGFLIVPVLVAVGLNEDRDGSLNWVREAAIYAFVGGSVVALGLFGVLNGGLAMMAQPDETVVSWVGNEQALITKPLWHIALGAAVGCAAVPVMTLVWAVRIRNRLSLGEAWMIVARRMENRYYSKMGVAMGLAAVGWFAAWIPGVQLVVPGFVAAVSLALYERIMATYR